MLRPILFAPYVDARLVASLVSSAELYERLDAKVNLTAEEFEGAILPRVVTVLHAFVDEHKTVPGSIVALHQYVFKQVAAGKLTVERVDDVFGAMTKLAVDAPPMTDDELVTVLAPELQKRARERLISEISGASTEPEKADALATKITEVSRIGEASARIVYAGADMAKIPESPKTKLPLYVQDLDVPLAGGLEISSYTLAVAASGSGKCHAKGQGILLASGEVRKVENIQVGDRLAAPGGAVRTVLRTNRGEGRMFDVVPVKGATWRVNADHVLTLKLPKRGVVDVSVADFLQWSPASQRTAKLIRSGYDFEGGAQVRRLELDPYVLGVFLGDGSTSDGSVTVCTPDSEIVAALHAYATAHKSAGVRISVRGQRGAATTYGIAGPRGRASNPLINALRKLGLYQCQCEDRRVPPHYLTAERSVRAQVLAGLLDTDGNLSKGGYDYISKSPQLALDVAFLARSLGLAAYVKATRKECVNTGVWGNYYRVSISGHTNTVPCRVTRKKAPPRKQIKDALCTGFVVLPTGQTEDYYGFTLDGDGRYLLDDFTVTHNSMFCLHAACVGSLHGYRSALVTTELSVSKQYARMLSWYTKVPYDIVMADRSRAEAKLAEMDLPTPILIDCGQEPTVPAILKTVAEAEAVHGPIQVLVIDHLDDVTESMAAASKDASTYVMFKRICSSLHRHAVRNNLWVITATQAKAQAGAVRKSAIAPPTKEEASESMYKVRKADVVIGLAVDPTTGNMLAGLGKNRNGPPAGAVFPHGLECCRISHAAADLAIASYRVRKERVSVEDEEFVE